MEQEIKYEDLSQWLKIAIIGGHISWVSFIIGFILGLLGVW